MFSTTLTTFDASPRAMEQTTQLLFSNKNKAQLLVLDCMSIFRNLLDLKIWEGQYGFLGKNSYGFIVFNSTVLCHFKLYINYWKAYSKRTPTQYLCKDFEPCWNSLFSCVQYLVFIKYLKLSFVSLQFKFVRKWRQYLKCFKKE